MNVNGAEQYVLKLLGEGLSPTLYYHGLHHTLDVTKQSLILAAEEGVTDEESRFLLKTAALFHDIGFLNVYKDHEDIGCEMAREVLPAYQYSKVQIEQICGMIMATKIPQSPKTHLEKILCDADLDYLGRDDFDPIAKTLFEELAARNLVTEETIWNQIQVKFIGAHAYHTEAARNKREAAKQQHLEKLKTLVAL